jgi:hypothetical protein
MIAASHFLQIHRDAHSGVGRTSAGGDKLAFRTAYFR